MPRSATTPAAVEQSEGEFVTAIIELAWLCGWRVAHFRPARVGDSWRTPVQGDNGFVDLVLARRGVALFWEAKRKNGKTTPDQEAWLAALPQSRTRVVRPSDWNWIVEELR